MSIHVHKIGLYSSVGGVADSYAVGGNSPDVVADFVNEYYRVGGTVSDFPTMFSGYTTRSDLATMVDSDGYIKWCPHNLCVYSEDLSDANWVKSGGRLAVTSDAVTGPTGVANLDAVYETDSTTNTDTLLDIVVSNYANQHVTFKFLVRKGDRQYVKAFLASGSGHYVGVGVDLNASPPTVNAYSTGTGSNASASISSDLGSGTYLVTLSGQAGTTTANLNVGIGTASSNTAGGSYGCDSVAGTTNDILGYFGAFHCYYTSLGGVVDIPTDARVASGTTFANYVPTTSSAIFRQRRGNHIYNGSSWVNKGIQIETEARTNLITASNDIDAYNATPSVVTANSTTSPDGTTNASTLADPNSGGTTNIRLDNNHTLSLSTTYTYSVFCKADGVIYAALQTSNFTTPANTISYFNLSTGAVVSTGAGHTATIVNYGNGWYRCAITFTLGASDDTGILRVYASQDGTSVTVDSDGTSSIFLYGQQLEAGSTTSSYIPTSGATVSRAADSLQIPAANMSYSATAMSFQINGTWQGNGNLAAAPRPIYWVSSPDYIDFYTTNGTTFTFRTANTGNDGLVTRTKDITALNVDFNFAIRVAPGTAFNAASDGTAATADTTIDNMPAVSSGNMVFNQAGLLSTIGQFRQWDVDLGDSGIQTAST